MKAFAPGHVTGFFAVHDGYPDLSHRGSRGGGWSLTKGCYAQLEPAEEMQIFIDGGLSEAPVTRDALQRLGAETYRVDLVHELPVGQGFGMSAAGTLAACLAVTHAQGLDPEAALLATHEAEVAQSTGLGDAVGSWFGNGELRIKPGCPPHGWAMQVHSNAQFLFCVLGDTIETGRIIRDPDWKERTRRLGDAAVDRVLEIGREGAWQALLQESHDFSQALGLMPSQMLALGKQLPEDVRWGQCMLGGTMWVSGAAGDLDRAEALLEGHGDIIRCGVDTNGARLVRHVPVHNP